MEIFGNWQFFWVDRAGLGIYHMGGFGRIGVRRVNVIKHATYLNIAGSLP